MDVEQKDNFVKKLINMEENEILTIHKMTLDEEASRRLRELGFCEKCSVKCVSKNISIICQIGNSRFALSCEVANNIEVI